MDPLTLATDHYLDSTAQAGDEFEAFRKTPEYQERLASEITEMLTNDPDFIQEGLEGSYNEYVLPFGYDPAEKLFLISKADYQRARDIGKAINDNDAFELFRLISLPIIRQAAKRAETIIEENY